MKKQILTFTLCLSILFSFTSCSNNTRGQKNLDTVDLPVIYIDGTQENIYAEFYPDGFDFEYENLPILTVTKTPATLKINLSDTFDNPVQIGEDYYRYTEDAGTIEKETYDLTKDKDNTVFIDIDRRGDVKDEQAVYFVENSQGTFVFKVSLPL